MEIPKGFLLPSYERRQCLPAVQHEDRQLRKLQSLVAYCQRHIPYYRTLFRESGFDPADLRTLEDLRCLPCLEKSVLRAHREDLLSREKGLRTVTVHTSGSTGYPLAITQDRAMRRARTLTGMLYNTMTGLSPRAVSVRFFAEPVPGSWSLREELSRRRHSYLLPSDCLTPEMMRGYAEAAASIRPDFFAGYSSVLELIARFALAEGVRFPAVRSARSTAGTLTAKARELIERAFGAPVYNLYSCREFGAIAGECAHRHGLHVFTERVYLEVLRNGRPVPDGEPGELVLTDLDNRAMPLIRYRLGDVGALSLTGCTCGRTTPLLERVEGRATDYCVDRYGAVYNLANLDHHVFADQDWVARIQYRQDDPTHLLVLVQPEPGAIPPLDLIERRLAMLLPTITCRIEPGEILPGPNGKTPLLVSSLPRGDRSPYWE